MSPTLDPGQPTGDLIRDARTCEACRVAAAVTAIALHQPGADVDTGAAVWHVQVLGHGRIDVSDTAALCGRCLADAHALGLIQALPASAAAAVTTALRQHDTPTRILEGSTR
jgi:hypothetical protein